MMNPKYKTQIFRVLLLKFKTILKTYIFYRFPGQRPRVPYEGDPANFVLIVRNASVSEKSRMSLDPRFYTQKQIFLYWFKV